MKIVVIHGFTGSDNYGGERTPEGIPDDADVVIGIYEPQYKPIVMRAPEGVEVLALQGHHLSVPTLHESITPEKYQAEINLSWAEAHR